MRRLGSSIVRLSTVGSTNDAAAAIATEGAVVVADQQTDGRGRRGHSWFSPPGAGLYVSIVLAPSTAADPPRATQLLTIAVGVALAEAIEPTTGLRPDLKWPNDLYIGRRKLGGVLAEASSATVVVGYGINVHAAAFPPELGDRATSLESELGRRIDREALLAATLTAIDRRYDDLLESRFDAILDAWRRRAPTANESRVEWLSGSNVILGITKGIDDDGALIVRVGDSTERIVGGEIRWL
jgi:BirA family transcriptional regulator, biotin operon repressor / biotin---[acetyl-CoA-carboxylase] ligase